MVLRVRTLEVMAQLNVASVLNVNYRWLLKYERNRYATQNIKKIAVTRSPQQTQRVDFNTREYQI